MTIAVIVLVIMNVATAISDRTDSRDSPYILWSLVQLSPRRAPNPTSSPAIAIAFSDRIGVLIALGMTVAATMFTTASLARNASC